MERRHFLELALAAGLAPAAASALAAGPSDAGAATPQSSEQHHREAMARHGDLTAGEHLTIAMLVYPGMFLQDLVGPLAVFESLLNRTIHLVWKNRETVGNEKPEHPTLVPVTPTTSFADCPQAVDVLFVPGGVPGTFTQMEDPEVLDFLRDRASRARFVTSVCTGSLILGAAGLLRGYRATSHWATFDVLGELGAIPTRARVVQDRNRITGGGVTAGIDFGLQIVSQLRSRSYAEAVQLYLEYDPQPPFDAGTPATAPAEVNAFLTDMFAGMQDLATATARRARARWPA
jgi:cyclohexyl-isocyanide hydratase